MHTERSDDLAKRDDSLTAWFDSSRRLEEAGGLVTHWSLVVYCAREPNALHPADGFLGSRSLNAMLLDELSDTLGRLRTFAEPIVDALEIELQTALLARRNRVEIADLLQGHTTLAHAAVSHHDVIKGLFFRPATGKPDRNHLLEASKTLRNIGPPGSGLPEKGADLTSKGWKKEERRG
jgi:hypothetical protein